MTREEWLNAALDLMRKEFFSKPPHVLPSSVAVSCGIPAGSVRAIGQCWDSNISKGGTTEIFICPSQDDPKEVLAILLHEACHAVIGVKEKHGPAFVRMMKLVGLSGKPTSTICEEGSKLDHQLTQMCETLGKYPHSSLNKSKRRAKKDQAKSVKLFSKTFGDYSLSVKQELIEQHGKPLDPAGVEMVTKQELKNAEGT